ncbi:hypothetical protein [Caldiplasma sukawensis]
MTDENIKEFLEKLKNRSISISRYSLKMSFGIYYSIWVISIFYYVYISPSILIFLNNFLGYLIEIISFIIVTTVAFYFNFRTFSLSFKTTKINKVFRINEVKSYGKIYRIFNLIFFPIYLIILLLILILYNEKVGYTLFYFILLIVPVYLLFFLKVSFGNIPIEGYIASLTYLFSVISSIITILFFNISGQIESYLQLIWAPTIIGWAFASMYSFYTATGDLGLYEE